ncbi:aminodeoxychorismate synthase component I [Candidatus Solirubrobacter pratensis]|uniref:aminodeoxychorismate synthase component I n=1 Tax=Candidatus Solirubrobacter pratensis TaxID=1298857 RepID=UPI0004083564|nr:aminodeoxychorismate synthase component I [Candidatus Solirubrobacter pratensis]
MLSPARAARIALDCSLPPERVLLALRDEPWPFALTGRWAGGGAIVGASPVQVLDGEDPFQAVDRVPPARGDAVVGGGWFGWLGYGLGARVERVPPRPPRPAPLPDAHLAYYDHVLRLDAEGRWWFEALATPAREAALDARLEAVRAKLAAAPEGRDPGVGTFTLRAPGAAGHTWAVRECVERIAAGEIFQANLCLRLETQWSGDVTELFARAAGSLRPAYGACFPAPWGGIASLSPELFLRRAGREVATGPIKGTMARPGDPAALRESAKDRAEHVMIVDLMRNDLGRVCEYGSVVAPDAPEAQPHPGVWHLVSEVRGRLREDAGDGALLRAAFPPGSVTGAPKVQALRVISELEATGREVYTGAIGFASPLAGLELNVAIRTFEARDGLLWLGAGGGIVADSDPQLELEECLVKARPLIAAAGGEIAPVEARGDRAGAPPALAGGGLRPDPDRGVFETVLVRDGAPVNLDAHLRRLRARPELPAVEGDGALRITAGGTAFRPLRPRRLPIVLEPYVLPGGLGDRKWQDRDLLRALSRGGTTPLLLDADGAVLEAAWAAVLIRRGDRLYTPEEDGRILASTSRPGATQRRLTLADLRAADEILLSSSLAGLVPAVLR